MARLVSSQMDQLRAQGWQIDASEVTVSGFPFDLRQTYTVLKIIDPAKTTYEFPTLSFSAKAYWPGYATVALPDAPIKMIEAGAPHLSIQLTGAEIALHLRPNTAFEVQHIGVQSGPWQVTTSTGNILSAEDLSLTLTQNHIISETYDFGIGATKLSPGDIVRAALQTPPNTPLAFDAYAANGSVQLDSPLDRRMLDGTPPQPVAVNLSNAGIKWGALSLSATASINIDQTGTPDGLLTAKLQNWQELLEYAELAGFISSNQRGQVTLMMGIFANMSGTPGDIELKIQAASGQLNINGIEVGAAPKLFQH